MSSVTVQTIVRLSLLLVVMLGFAYFLQRRFRAFTHFKNEKSTALNLAVVRIAVMGAMLAIVHLPYIMWFAGLQRPLLYPIQLWQPWLLYRGNTQLIITTAYIALVVVNISGLIGLMGRLCCFISAILFAFLMGIPQLFGQVNHTEHHLVIFALILASAPCSDALSVDAIIMAFRNGDRRRFVRLRPSLAYAFPIKAMLIVLSLVYLFPGIWKVSRVGSLWFSGKNMQLLLAMKMYEAGATPLRIWAVNHLTLQSFSSAGTIVFELGFIFAILFPRIRPLAGIVGIMFHGTIFFLMGINFGALVACYVLLVNWTDLLALIERRLRLSPLTVLFDGNCKLCRRTVSVLLAFDWVGQLEVFPNQHEHVWPTKILGLTSAAAVVDRFVAIDHAGQVAFGYNAYEMIASRVPILWPLRLLMYVPGVDRIGTRIYERVAQSRTCSIRDTQAPINLVASSTPVGFGLMGSVAGAAVLSLLLMGFSHSINAWPISCFPTFDWPATETQLVLFVDSRDVAGQRHAWTVNFDPQLGEVMTPERLQGMLRTFTNQNHEFSKDRACALLHLWEKYHPFEKPLADAVFYADEYHVLPDLAEKAPIRHVRLGEVTSADGL